MSWGWREYVPVAQRRANAARYAAKLAKKEGRELQPVDISGRTIAKTFWGKAWCENLESYSDFANRLPRGRTYVRNGSVIDLQVSARKVTAIVSGSEIYHVEVSIAPLKKAQWSRIKKDCSQSIDSVMDLLQGRFSQGVMERLTRQKDGLFPEPKEITLECSCPDWANLCKHVAAVLYGVGARLDVEPEVLFLLREVDHLELISQAGANLDEALDADDETSLQGEDLGAIFGIDLDASGEERSSRATPTKRKTAKKKTASRKAPAARGKTAKKKVVKKTTAKKKTAKRKTAKKKTSAAKQGIVKKKKVSTTRRKPK